jgi:hypothetical protein
LLVGLTLFVVSIFLFYDDWRFSQEARSTEGTVLTKDVRQSDDSTSADRAGTSPTKHYEATYSFTVEDETLEGRDELTQDGWERLTEGGTVEVLYLPGDPSSNRLAGSRPWILKTMFGLIGLVFTPLGATTLVREVRRNRLETRLQQHGVSTKGTVTQLGVGHLKINDVSLWRLQYEYEDSQGRRHVKTLDLPEEEARQWKVGEAGLVRYDSATPTEAIWLGRS